MPKWLMRAGKVIFMAVSTITPQKDMMPVATTAPITLRGIAVFCACCVAWVALMSETPFQPGRDRRNSRW